MLKLKDFSRSQAVTFFVKVAIFIAAGDKISTDFEHRTVSSVIAELPGVQRLQTCFLLLSHFTSIRFS